MSDRVAELLQIAGDGKLTSLVAAVRELDALEHPWAQAKVYVARNFTVEQLEPHLKLAAYRLGIQAQVQFGDLDTYRQDALDGSSALRSGKHDLVVLALWLDSLPMAFSDGTLDVTAVRDHVTQLAAAIPALAVHTFLPPFRRVAGGAELHRLNAEIRSLEHAHVVDLAEIAGGIGLSGAVDPRYFYLYRSPLTPRLLSAWAQSLALQLARVSGRVRKVIALDCDNCLWGGVVGEDGLDGIKLDPHDYPGSAHYTFQQQLLMLQRRGILLALCSKNNEADALEVLDRHPHSAIRRQHLAGWRINWDNKADNLRALARDLNLGLDSFVFIDDSAVECELIRRELPMVEVLQIPKNTYDLPSLLAREHGFPSARTEEDRTRTALYQAERERSRASQSFTDVDAFLRSLELRVDIGAPTPAQMARVAQLTQRTNQFNLTTRRYEQPVIELLAEQQIVLCMSVADKYGDYGLTGVAVAVREEEGARIDSFLMSCRVLGRRVEDILLGELIREVNRRWRPSRITADYLATAKNAQVAQFFDARGFSLVSESGPHRAYAVSSSEIRVVEPEFVVVNRRA